MKLSDMHISRVIGMCVLLAALVIPLAAAPFSGPRVLRAQAAEETKWVLRETRLPPATFQKDVPQPDGSLWKYTVTASETTVSYRSQSLKEGNVQTDVTYTWTFDRPPRELIPGQTVELHIQGKVIGQVSSILAWYSYQADYVENFQQKSANEIARIRLNSTNLEVSGVLRFTVPPTPPRQIGGGQITLIAGTDTVQTVVGTPGRVVWIYGTPEEAPPEEASSVEPVAPAVSDPLFNADGSLNRTLFDQVWKKYSDLDDRIPLNERSYEAQQWAKTASRDEPI